MIRAGLQIPNFTFPDTAPEDLFEKVASIAVTGEENGFDTVMVMDHFYQLPLLGPPEHEMFEAYTLLGALAARTTKARLGTLVTGVTYRNPAILAKIVTALDVISKGRAFLGIGAAWYDVEHEGLGVDFPAVKVRFEMLEEALQITRAMFRSEKPTFEGTHYRVKEALNVPAPIQPGGPPIMIGGQGEKKTLRMMAQYADMANFTSGFDEIPRKLEILAGHCADVGRDFGEINKTSLGTLVIAPTTAEAEAQRDEFLQARGLDWNALDDATKAMLTARMVIGDPDFVAERVQALLDLGLDGVCFNMPGSSDLDLVALAGKTISAVVN